MNAISPYGFTAFAVPQPKEKQHRFQFKIWDKAVEQSQEQKAGAAKRPFSVKKISQKFSAHILKKSNLILSSGNRYVGALQRGIPHGKGREYLPTKDLAFVGQYEHGKRIEGTLFKNGEPIYTGKIKNAALLRKV